MDKQIVIKLDKLNCSSKCCGSFFFKRSPEEVDGVQAKQPVAKEKNILCCFGKRTKTDLKDKDK